MKPGVLWVAEWVRSGTEAKGWALAEVCHSARRVSEAGARVCRSRMCSRRVSVHGSEVLVKGKESTSRE